MVLAHFANKIVDVCPISPSDARIDFEHFPAELFGACIHSSGLSDSMWAHEENRIVQLP